MSIRYVLGSGRSIGGVLGSGRGGAAAAWYLAGGVSAANCIAAYTPKGAASLAASYDNNAAPGNGLADGTYDAAPGVAPSFDTATGWTMGGKYLATGITPTDTTWSAIIRFSNATGNGNDYCLFGALTSGTRTFFIQRKTLSNHQYGNGGSLAKSGALTQGVLAIAGSTGYLNGTSEGTIGAGTAPAVQVYIGALNISGSALQPTDGTIQAFAIYNATLSAAQVAAISAAMAAL